MQAEEAVIIIYILASHCVRVPVSVYVVIMSAKKVKEKKPTSLVKLGHVRFVNYLEKVGQYFLETDAAAEFGIAFYWFFLASP